VGRVLLAGGELRSDGLLKRLKDYSRDGGREAGREKGLVT